MWIKYQIINKKTCWMHPLFIDVSLNVHVLDRPVSDFSPIYPPILSWSWKVYSVLLTQWPPSHQSTTRISLLSLSTGIETEQYSFNGEYRCKSKNHPFDEHLFVQEYKQIKLWFHLTNCLSLDHRVSASNFDCIAYNSRPLE